LKNSIPAAIGPISESLRRKISANLRIRLRFLLLDLPKSTSISLGAVLQQAATVGHSDEGDGRPRSAIRPISLLDH
jgi:hypothetical protein